MTSRYRSLQAPKPGAAAPGPNPPTRKLLASLPAVIPEGRGWTAPCPCHDDAEHSLLIAEDPHGMPALHCLAGCSRESLVAHFCAAGAWPASSGPEPPPEEDLRRILIESRPLWTAEAGVALQALRRCGLATERLPRLLFHRSLKRPSRKGIGPEYPALVIPLWSVGGRIKALHCLLIGGPVAGSERFVGSCNWGFRPGLAARFDRLKGGEPALALCQDFMTGFAVRQATRLPVWATQSVHHLAGVKLPGSIWKVHLFAGWDRFGQCLQIAREVAECLASEGRRVYLHLPRPAAGDRASRSFLDVLKEEGEGPLRQAVETARPFQSEWERSWKPPKALREASPAPGAGQVQRLLGWISGSRRRRFTRRQALRALPLVFPNSRSLKPAMNVLLACEFIRPLQGPGPRRGRGRPPGPLYEVNPWLLEQEEYSPPERSE